MQFGQIPFDMTRRSHQTGSEDYCLLKRWKKYSIYSKSGSWNRTDSPNENLYTTNSVYLYDYVSVTKTFYNSLIYTLAIADSTPDPYRQVIGQILWYHDQYTFLNTPNSLTNNITQTTRSVDQGIVYYNPVIYIDNGEYFELETGYPRNHQIHKRPIFSLYNIKTSGTQNGVDISGSYFRCQQTISTTIGENGLEDGTSPIQSFTVGNLNLIQGSNVINS